MAMQSVSAGKIRRVGVMLAAAAPAGDPQGDGGMSGA
jgi:hypothetical protein